jgi:hypothetical protein
MRGGCVRSLSVVRIKGANIVTHREVNPVRRRIPDVEAARRLHHRQAAAPEPLLRSLDFALGRQLDREVAKTGGVFGWSRGTLAGPGVEGDQVRHVARDVDVPYPQRRKQVQLLEAEHIAVEAHRVVDVGDVQMDVADLRPFGDQHLERLARNEVPEEGVQVERVASRADVAVGVQCSRKAVG